MIIKTIIYYNYYNITLKACVAFLDKSFKIIIIKNKVNAMVLFKSISHSMM